MLHEYCATTFLGAQCVIRVLYSSMAVDEVDDDVFLADLTGFLTECDALQLSKELQSQVNIPNDAADLLLDSDRLLADPGLTCIG